MSDELSFFESEPEAQAPAPEQAQPTEPAQQSQPQVTPEQIADMQRRLESAERWKQDFQRMSAQLAGIPQETQPDPNQRLTEFLKDPIRFEEELLSKAEQRAIERAEQQAIISDRRAKHPELAQLEGLIDWEAAMGQAANTFRQKNGRVPSFAEALDESIAYVKSNIQGILQGSQAQSQGQVATRMAMNLDLSGGQPTTQQVDPMKMSDSEWVKYRNAAMQGLSGY